MKSKLFSCIIIIMTGYQAAAQGVWTQKANFGGGSVTEARAFAIGNYGYVGGPTASLWRYDPVNDIWAQMATFTGPVRSSPVAFSIGNKGYIGTGGSFNDFYEYDAAANTWTQKANFGGSGREGAVGTSVNGKGYIGTGGSYLNDWWEYDTTLNAWTQKANLAGPTRYHGGAFAVNGKAYVSTGFNGTFYNDLLEYDPQLNSWTSKAPLPSTTRDRPVGLATLTKGYIIGGWSGSASLNDAWEYDPVTDSWTQLPNMPGAGRYNACGFTIGSKLYTGTGIGGQSDWFEYAPDCSALASAVATTCPGVCDGMVEITSPDPLAVVSYLWSTGDTTASVLNLCAGTYMATVTDTAGCVTVISVDVTQPDSITATAGVTQPTCFGDSDGELCANTTVSPATYLWSNGATTSCITGIPAGTYTITITDSLGCEGVIPLILPQPGPISFNFNITNATCQTCPNGVVSAQVLGGVAPFTYLWSTGSTLAFINGQLPGFYSFCATDANGCVSCDTAEISYPSALNEPVMPFITLSPNPFHDQLQIELHGGPGTLSSIRLLDLSGREVQRTPLYGAGAVTLNTHALPPGIYFLEVTGSTGSRTFKVARQ